MPVVEMTLPSRIDYMLRLLDLLREEGGSLPSTRIFSRLITDGHARPSDIETLQPSGETRFAKEVRFARLELDKAGLLITDRAGFWSLSEEGWKTFLTAEEARVLVHRRRHGIRAKTERPAALKPTTGPCPVAYSATITRSIDRASWTYVLRYGLSNVWKIGHTENVKGRMADVNRHIPVEHTGDSWRLFARHRHPNSFAAYQMEQALFRILEMHRTQGERLRCAADCLISAWRQCVDHSTTPAADI